MAKLSQRLLVLVQARAEYGLDQQELVVLIVVDPLQQLPRLLLHVKEANEYELIARVVVEDEALQDVMILRVHLQSLLVNLKGLLTLLVSA